MKRIFLSFLTVLTATLLSAESLDWAFFWYENKYSTLPWTLVLTNSHTSNYEPFVTVEFTSGSNTKVAGEYNIGTNANIYEDYEDYYYTFEGYSAPLVTSKSGTLKLIRRADDAYEIWLAFTGNDNKEYEIHDLFTGVYAEDKDEQKITLTDPIEEVVTAVDVVTNDKPAAVKSIENGQIVIKLGEKTYTIIGTQIH